MKKEHRHAKWWLEGVYEDMCGGWWRDCFYGARVTNVDVTFCKYRICPRLYSKAHNTETVWFAL